MLNDLIGHSVSERDQNCSVLGGTWVFLAAAQPLPAPRVGWVKPAPGGTQGSGLCGRAVFQNGKMVQW